MDDDKTLVITWASAFLHYQFEGEPDDLAELLTGTGPIPMEARAWLAQIVKGELKLGSRRGKDNSTLSWPARKQIRDGLSKVYRNSEIVLCFIDELADAEAVEPIDIRRKMEKVRRDAIRALETRYDISESGIRKIAEIGKSIDFGKMLCGIEADGWGHFYDAFAKHGHERREKLLAFATRILKTDGDHFDPLTPEDSLTQAEAWA